jgi:hypothetical protein
MFDMRLSPTPGQTEDLMRKGWEGMMKLTLLERFGTYHWLHEWTPGRPFDNLFLVRKPRMAAAVIETDAEREQRLMPAQVERLDLLKQTFCAEPTVQKHLADPACAWDAMLALNDGGITRLAAYLGDVASPRSKRARIAEQLDAIADDLVRHRFAGYYRGEGAAELAGKQRLAEGVLAALKPRASGFAELLSLLQPSRAGLRALYLRADDAGAEHSAAAPAAGATEAATPPASGAFGDLIDLDAMLNAAPPDASVGGFQAGTANGNQAENRSGLPSPKQRVPLRLRAVPILGRPPQGLARGQCAHGAVGHRSLGPRRPHRRTDHRRRPTGPGARTGPPHRRGRGAGRGHALALGRASGAYRPCAYRALRRLPGMRRHGTRCPSALASGPAPWRLRAAAADSDRPPADASRNPLNYSGLFILDWFEAFRALAIANAGHATGREIAPEQNARLGAILARIDGSPRGHAMKPWPASASLPLRTDRRCTQGTAASRSETHQRLGKQRAGTMALKLSLESTGPGRGLLRIGGTRPTDAAESVNLAIQRNDGRYLGLHGQWQPTPHWHPQFSAEPDPAANGFNIALGAALLDGIIAMQGAPLRVTARLDARKTVASCASAAR